MTPSQRFATAALPADPAVPAGMPPAVGPAPGMLAQPAAAGTSPRPAPMAFAAPAQRRREPADVQLIQRFEQALNAQALAPAPASASHIRVAARAATTRTAEDTLEGEQAMPVDALPSTGPMASPSAAQPAADSAAQTTPVRQQMPTVQPHEARWPPLDAKATIPLGDALVAAALPPPQPDTQRNETRQPPTPAAAGPLRDTVLSEHALPRPASVVLPAPAVQPALPDSASPHVASEQSGTAIQAVPENAALRLAPALPRAAHAQTPTEPRIEPKPQHTAAPRQPMVQAPGMMERPVAATQAASQNVAVLRPAPQPEAPQPETSQPQIWQTGTQHGKAPLAVTPPAALPPVHTTQSARAVDKTQSTQPAPALPRCAPIPALPQTVQAKRAESASPQTRPRVPSALTLFAQPSPVVMGPSVAATQAAPADAAIPRHAPLADASQPDAGKTGTQRGEAWQAVTPPAARPPVHTAQPAQAAQATPALPRSAPVPVLPQAAQPKQTESASPQAPPAPLSHLPLLAQPSPVVMEPPVASETATSADGTVGRATLTARQPDPAHGEAPQWHDATRAAGRPPHAHVSSHTDAQDALDKPESDLDAPVAEPAVAVAPAQLPAVAPLPVPQYVSADIPADVHALADTALRERLIESVQQLLVSVPQTPGEPVQVRMVLHDSVLPGTAVTVQQMGAQLQVSFECTAHSARQRLERNTPALAQSLSRRLGRDVLVEVQDATGDGLLPIHARADARETS